MAFTLHDGIEVGAGPGPEVRHQGLAPIWIGLVPKGDVAVAMDAASVMGSLLFDGRISSGVRTMAGARHGVDYVGGNRSGLEQSLEGGRGRKLPDVLDCVWWVLLPNAGSKSPTSFNLSGSGMVACVPMVWIRPSARRAWRTRLTWTVLVPMASASSTWVMGIAELAAITREREPRRSCG
jgi:hypothetical protein